MYFDTDVEVVKSFDAFLKYDAFFGFELNNLVNIGVGFGAIKHVTIIKLLMNQYKDINFILETGDLDLTPCPSRNFSVFQSLGFKKDNTSQCVDNVVVFPSEFFCPKNYFTSELNTTENTYSIHHFDASWYPKDWALIKKKRDKKNKRENRKKRIRSFVSKIYHSFKKD